MMEGNFNDDKWKRRQDIPRLRLRDVKLKRILQLFRPYRFLFIALLAFSIGAAILRLLPPLLMKEVIDKALPEKDKNYLILLIIGMAGLPVIGGLLELGQNHLNNRVGQGIMSDLRKSLYKNLQQQSIAFFTRTRTGEIIQRVVGDVSAIQSIFTTLSITAVTQIITILSTIIILFTLDWRLALLAMVVMPLLVFPVRSVSNLRKNLRWETQKVRGDMSSQVGEEFNVSGAMMTRIFTREDYQEKRFLALNKKVMELELRSNLVGRWFRLLTGLLEPVSAAIIYFYGGFGVIGGRMTIGAVVAFAAYLGRLYNPLSNLLNLHVECMTSLGIFQRIFEYLDLEPDIKNVPNAYKLPALEGHILFKEVSFSYQAGKEALQQISFAVEPGRILALVGPSGSGKTTLINLICRLYDPTGGHIEIDGHDIHNVTLESLRGQIAVVTQDQFLFHASIRENLLFAREDATQEMLEDACRSAYIHDFITQLTDGYETIVGERGFRLSGGQRQRLSIARAILKDPRILILDEATSYLDSESEAYIQKALDSVMSNRTTIVIAHRLATVLQADKILVMENGCIQEEGSHSELLKMDGLYAKLFHTQFAKKIGT
ncbi:putative ABC transporter ATP-binding protein [Ruminiclostridium hungatei]|uniref:Putative ABC transporter ATP-binding protein n=1 Tax=Ruminiclostridium hungatei TaxID=48256 RepID=A0A1V4SNB8_RUMHU|nr:ABC transporter ATP-binding protein [Ruminiclostridium hungatei]OPX44965.1 putative ABC transporter ATP-binding protein [Ruminiclostridium hungatei]